jgi:uncharacterized membrane protein
MNPAGTADRVRTSLWFVPVTCVAAGVLLSIVTLAIDRAGDYEVVPRQWTGGPDVAAEILSTVALSMVSLATLVLTITMVVVQLAMGQFSPRIVQTFLQDKPSQIAIGLFVATFAHAILSLREVDTAGDTVPGLAIVVAFVMVVASIVVLVLYVHHIGRSLRVSSLIELVGGKTRSLLEQTYPDQGEPGPNREDELLAQQSGVIRAIAHDDLVDLATAAGCSLELLPALGEFVPAGAPLVRVNGELAGLDLDRVRRAIALGLERTFDQDVAYGFRMLVDIAERSLAESAFQDPTTAVQALDRLHDCLRQLAPRPFPDGVHRDAAGEVRLVTRVMTWDGFVRLAFEEIRMAGSGSPQVSRRLRAALEDLLEIAPPERRAVLDEQLELLDASAQASVSLPADVTFALRPDRLGLGIDAGLNLDEDKRMATAPDGSR